MTDADSGNTCRLAAALHDIGLSQAQLSAELDQLPNVVSRWVNGVEPRRANKHKLLGVLRAHGWQGTGFDLWPIDEPSYCAEAS